MIYTSYFNSNIQRQIDLPRYQVSLSAYVELEKATELLLPRHLFNRYYIRTIDLKQLKEGYRKEVLDKLDPMEIYKKYDETILLCHEEHGCHREEILSWLGSHGLPCCELEAQDLEYLPLIKI